MTVLNLIEVEIIAALEGARLVVWLKKLTRDLGERNDDDDNSFIPTLYYNNKGTVDLLYDTKYYQRAKHIKTRYLFIQNNIVQRDRLKVVYILGKDQPRDILTKQLPID